MSVLRFGTQCKVEGRLDRKMGVGKWCHQAWALPDPIGKPMGGWLYRLAKKLVEDIVGIGGASPPAGQLMGYKERSYSGDAKPRPPLRVTLPQAEAWTSPDLQGGLPRPEKRPEEEKAYQY